MGIVIVSVNLSGHSHPNTVCGGACKEALVHVAKVFDEAFSHHRSAYKLELRADDIFLRGSQHLRVASHVHSSKKYKQRYGKGAKPSSGPSKKPKNRTVVEYPPK
jgi:hypothetical protein